MTPRTFTAVSLLALGVSVSAAQLTLPQLAKLRGPEPVSRSRTRELVPPSFEDIVARADLIVQGRVAQTKTYLSNDQIHLFTDFVVAPTRVVLQRTGLTVRRPGESTEIIVKQFGGTTMIDGVQVSDSDDDMPLLQNGANVLLILVYNKEEAKYQLPDEVAGAFSVAGSRIAPLLRASRKFERFHGMDVTQFEAEVRRLRP
jgi:hypothetical protein